MIIHHVVTTSLMVMSWTANMVRVGTLVLCVHDAVDYLLEVRVKFRCSVNLCLCVLELGVYRVRCRPLREIYSGFLPSLSFISPPFPLPSLSPRVKVTLYSQLRDLVEHCKLQIVSDINK